MKRREFVKGVSVAGAALGGMYPSAMTGAGASGAEPGQQPAAGDIPPRQSGKKKNLLFFFTDEACPAAGAVTATLSWVAAKTGNDFEAYVCIRPKTWAGRILAFNGHGHQEQFYYLANFYEKVLYCSLTESPAVQFKREVMAFGGDVISSRKPKELVEFYRDVFLYFKMQWPKELMVLPSRPASEDGLWVQPYCYPDVFFRQALGISEDAAENGFKRLKSVGAQKASLLYCSDRTAELARAAGLDVGIVDLIQPGDTYGTITCRIADRWIKRAKGVAFGDPVCTLKWQPHYIRERWVTLYQPTEWKSFVQTVGRYARQTGNHVIYGNQMVKPMDDNVVAAFSEQGMVMSLTGVDARIGTTLQSRKALPVDWLREARAPWEEECSDAFLQEQARKGGIPVCFLFYAADLGHLPVLSRVLDLMLVEGLKCGLAFPSTWYDFQPELLEQLYIPVDHGGVFPNVEPLMVSAGVGLATEAEGYLDASLFASSLREARRSIARHVGERLVPIGYYSFQDANPWYKHQSGRPPFNALEKAGFDYAVTYKDEDKPARIVHESRKFMAINQQNKQWFWHSWQTDVSYVLNRLKEWEKQVAAEEHPHGWIIFSFDMPSYGLCPHYLRGMEALVQAMTYAAAGGAQKKLFLAKPHEVVRYARILHKNQQI